MSTDEPDLQDLPLWVAVGFAARCARLVYPCFRAGYPEAPRDVLRDVDQAIQIAERFASQASGVPNYTADADADHAVDVAIAVKRWAADPGIENYSDAAAGAAYAAGAAADVADGCSWANPELVYANAARAVRGALCCRDLAPQIHQEHQHLVTRLAQEPLDDTDPFPAHWFS